LPSKKIELSELAHELLAIRSDSNRSPLDVEIWDRYYPQCRHDAYIVQDMVAQSLGPVCAWKAYRSRNSHQVVGAPIFDKDCYQSMDSLAGRRFRVLGVEAELGYRLSSDFSAQNYPYNPSDIFEMVDAIVPLIEVVDSRLKDFQSVSEFWQLSDNSVNGGIILGEPIEDWTLIEPREQCVNLILNDEVCLSGQGWAFLGDPITLIVDFLNNVACHGGKLKKGQIIATGSLTGLNFLNVGDKLRALFLGIDVVLEVQF